MLTAGAIAGLLEPYVRPVMGGDGGGPVGELADLAEIDWTRVYEALAIYLELILKWNARMSLTAIREPEEIVRRHFGESLFAGAHVGRYRTLLDFGSGAGFPGVPLQLMRPDVQVTLAESQGKKVAFLLEVVRELGLQSEVLAGRVEEMPGGRQFDVVAMRAVDKMGAAVREGAARTRARMLILGTLGWANYPEIGARFERLEAVRLPGSNEGVLLVGQR